MENLKEDTEGEKLKTEKWYEITGLQPPFEPSYKCKLFQKVKDRDGVPKTYIFKFIRTFPNNEGTWVPLTIPVANAQPLVIRPMNQDEIIEITETAESLQILTEAEDAAGIIKKKSKKSKKNLKKSKKSKKNLKKYKKSKKNLKKSKK